MVGHCHWIGFNRSNVVHGMGGVVVKQLSFLWTACFVLLCLANIVYGERKKCFTGLGGMALAIACTHDSRVNH